MMDINLNGTIFPVQTRSKNPIFFYNLLINFSFNDRVADEPRGFLYYDNHNNTWVFCGLSQNGFNQSTNTKNLILLLESPHKDEFDSVGNPLRPANGITGTKINQLLAQKVSGINLNQSTVYCVWLVNAIQYQTSAYIQLNGQNGYKKVWRTVRNAIFRTLWSRQTIRDDLFQRIHYLINPDLIINCVTGGYNIGLNGLVQSFLKSRISSSVQNYYLPHPSSW